VVGNKEDRDQWHLPTTNDERPTTASMGTRRKSRELALQMLFQADLGKQPIEDVRKTFWKGRGDVSPEVKGFAEDLFRVAVDRSSEIDKRIEEHAENWRMDRMAAVDRNILRGAVAELLGFPKTPRAVVINEAIEIARKFSAPESAQFINGVLDSVGKEIEAQASGVGG
jgi:N utilization substance protein B